MFQNGASGKKQYKRNISVLIFREMQQNAFLFLWYLMNTLKNESR